MHIRKMEADKTPLAKWMVEHDKTDESVATALCITRSQVNRVRNGVSNPSIATAKALSVMTGIPVQDLFRRPVHPNSQAAA